LENLELHKSSDSRNAQSSSTAATRRDVYRKASTVLGFVGAGLAAAGFLYVYFLLWYSLFIGAILMLVGSLMVWTRNTATGAALMVIGGVFGIFGLPWLLWGLLGAALGNWVYRLPLLPLGLIVPIASAVLAIMSREPSRSTPFN
jgi:hypothetical protein